MGLSPQGEGNLPQWLLNVVLKSRDPNLTDLVAKLMSQGLDELEQDEREALFGAIIRRRAQGLAFLWVGLFGLFQILGHLTVEPRQVLKRGFQLPVRHKGGARLELSRFAQALRNTGHTQAILRLWASNCEASQRC